MDYLHGEKSLGEPSVEILKPLKTCMLLLSVNMSRSFLENGLAESF